MIPTLDKQIEYLKKVGETAEDDIDIAETGLILASLDRPGVSLQKYHHHLEILKLDTAAESHDAKTAEERANSLIEVMWRRHEYRGNDQFYDDLQNVNLMSVIDRRLGLPISLGILYLHAAHSQGWNAEGVNFPAHFLIRVFGENDQVILDPFHKGNISLSCAKNIWCSFQEYSRYNNATIVIRIITFINYIYIYHCTWRF